MAKESESEKQSKKEKDGLFVSDSSVLFKFRVVENAFIPLVCPFTVTLLVIVPTFTCAPYTREHMLSGMPWHS